MLEVITGVTLVLVLVLEGADGLIVFPCLGRDRLGAAAVAAVAVAALSFICITRAPSLSHFSLSLSLSWPKYYYTFAFSQRCFIMVD